MKQKFLVSLIALYMLVFLLGAEAQYIYWVTQQIHDPKWGSPAGQMVGLVYHTGLIGIILFFTVRVAYAELFWEYSPTATWKTNWKAKKNTVKQI